VNELAGRIAARIGRDGPLPYSTVVDLALYDETAGFYATGGAAGRRGDFLTSVEVGPLFGAVVSRALDSWWRELGEPDAFTVVECGAGVGTLARAVLAAAPACATAREFRYLLVERSAALRDAHPVGTPFVSAAALPTQPIVGVVFANELLDNLAFDLLERREGSWHEVLVGVGPAGSLSEVLSRGPAEGVTVDGDEGARVPSQQQARDWVRSAIGLVRAGRVVVVDYADTTESMARRPWHEWLRTYRGHERGVPPLADLGGQDITCEVAVDQLAAVRPLSAERSQAEFLRAHGIDELVEEGRRLWQERAHLGDLAALRARSRVREAEALCDPDGLGAFRVLEWAIPTVGD
jgi:SAM-dependent MidA family methyltransferase